MSKFIYGGHPVNREAAMGISFGPSHDFSGDASLPYSGRQIAPSKKTRAEHRAEAKLRQAKAVFAENARREIEERERQQKEAARIKKEAEIELQRQHVKIGVLPRKKRPELAPPVATPKVDAVSEPKPIKAPFAAAELSAETTVQTDSQIASPTDDHLLSTSSLLATMSNAEALHFHRESADRAKFLDAYRQCLSTSDLDPQKVALKLNSRGFLTARARMWTPRLAQLLLALLHASP